ncbi:MAG TPA: amidohydrolase family protein [Desulfomonilaceae bacterium]|nr:amidohydrolase family protein [Desulfomonilaceae bacterium]
MRTEPVLPAVHDKEGDRVPSSLPRILDAHVHLFPGPLFEAIWQWFDTFAWAVRYKLTSPQIIEFLSSRGVERMVGLHYAHRSGMARDLNRYMAGLCRTFPQLTGLATVFPGETGAGDIMKEAFEMGLAGIKLHAHVQYFSLEDRSMHEIYEMCADQAKPLIMHVGREPKNPYYTYERDPYEICGAHMLEAVLAAYPELKICVPHLGANEFDEYRNMLELYDNLWLDTAMVLADYLPDCQAPSISDMRCDRIMYGTDFPNIPYAWDREIRRLDTLGLSEGFLEKLLAENAMAFLSMSM